MKDEVDSIVNDVKLYSDDLITALENKRHSETLDYVQEMKKCLKIID